MRTTAAQVLAAVSFTMLIAALGLGGVLALASGIGLVVW